MKRKLLVNLFGGPGTGKSTTAAHLFALCKHEGINCELIREYIKDWVWEGRDLHELDQFYIAIKQCRKEYTTALGVDLMITDSPALLGVYYSDPKNRDAVKQIVTRKDQYLCRHGYEIYNIFLNRVKPFNPAGRFQNEEESKNIDTELRQFLYDTQVLFKEIDGDDRAADQLLEDVMFLREV